jgi:uncharacterized protein (TIGR00730 family)
MKRLAVFCGSNMGVRPDYALAAMHLARICATRGIGIVYGGSRVGLMRVLADTVLAAGGKITGVIPHFLIEREGANERVSDLRIVRSMHERKALMAQLADGFLALPGGLGTLEEFFEILTWAQLGMHDKPCGLLNVAGYYDDLLKFINYAVAQKFIKSSDRNIIIVRSDPESIIGEMQRRAAFAAEKPSATSLAARS